MPVKLLTSGGGGVNLVPSSSIASDQTMYLPTSGTSGGTVLCTDSSGNLGIGTSSPSQKLTVAGKVALGTDYLATYVVNNGATNTISQIGDNATFGAGTAFVIGSTTAYLGFQTAGSERARIDSSGNLLVGTTNSSHTSGVGVKMGLANGNGTINCVFNSSVTGSTYELYNLDATYNGFRFYVNYNGGISNYQAYNSNISDERLKTDIVNADSYLEKICSIPVRKFRYKDQPEGDFNIGIIAQEAEAVAPELVNNEGFGATPDDGIPYKSIYQTDLQYALMRAIQELSAQNKELTQRIEALEYTKQGE